MHADVAGDDHLQAGQADARVRQHAEIEGAVRVGHVHHDLQRRRRHVAEVRRGAFEGQGACIDEACIALGAADRDRIAILDAVERVTGADHRGHAQLAGDDRGVAGAATAVGDDGGAALHHRLPVGIGHVGDQHVAGLHALHVGQRTHHARGAAADLAADRAAFRQHVAALAQRVALDLGRMRARLHRLRTRLQDVELAGMAVLAPLDVHRPAVVTFDHQRLLRQLLHVRIGNRKRAAQRRRRFLGAHAFARRVGIHHAQLLAAQRTAQDRRLAGIERGFVDVELVGIHRTLHDHLAQAVAGGDEDHVAETGFGVEGEQHAG